MEGGLEHPNTLTSMNNPRIDILETRPVEWKGKLDHPDTLISIK